MIASLILLADEEFHDAIFYVPILYTPHPPVHADVTLEHLDQEDKVEGFGGLRVI